MVTMHRHFASRLASCFLRILRPLPAIVIFLLATFEAATASIVDTGDVLESGGSLYAGNTAFGKREVANQAVSYVGTYLGNYPGVRGELFLTNTQSTNSAEIIVGVSGVGLFNLVRDNSVLAGSLSVGQFAGANGSVAIGPSTFDLGSTGEAIVGGAGSGSMTLSGLQYSTGTPIATFNSNRLTLGAQSGSNGSLTLSCGSRVQLGGDAPMLIIGNSGTGSVSLFADSSFCSPESIAVQGVTPGNAQTYVAKNAGSTGTLTLTGGVTFNAGDLMRVGMDEFDQPGGAGTVNIQPILFSTESHAPAVSAKLTKIGPPGKFFLQTGVDNSRAWRGIGAGITGDIENRGTFGGSKFTSVVGDVVNHAKLAAVADGYVDICCNAEHGPTIYGNFTQTASGEQEVKVLNSAFATDFLGTLTVNGAAHYDGKINILFQGGARLIGGDQFNVLSVPSGNATYEPTLEINFDTSGLNPALTPVADISPTGIVVRIVTNPSVSADLTLGMTDTPDPVLQGQTVNYTISVTNNGPSPATSIAVNGTLSSCYFSNIASGATATCTRTATAIAAGTLTQTMSVSGNEPDPNTTNNSASASTTVNPAANLGIAMTDTPDPVLQGQTVSYEITVTNNGPSPATGVVVSGSLPGCMLGNIAPGATASCTQTATASSVGTLTQTMTASGNEADPNTANNSATASTTVNPAADLALSMSDTPDPVKKRAKLVYKLTVVNNGPGSATNVSLTNTLPADVIFVSAVSSHGTCSGTATVTCAIGALGNGAIATVTITVKPKNVGTITNNASVTGAENDPNTANNSASATTVVKR